MAVTALLLAACGLLCAKNAEAPSRSIGVFFAFEDRPSAVTVDVLKSEVASIMKPAGLVFSWRELGGQQEPSSFADLIVLRFKGSCEGLVSPYSELGPGSDDLALAATKTSHGRVLHFTEVRCDEMRRYLFSDVVRLDNSARDAIYGRALGRIVAHEMWHVFADTEKLCLRRRRARLSPCRRELLQPVFKFDPKETQVPARLCQPGALVARSESGTVEYRILSTELSTGRTCFR